LTFDVLKKIKLYGISKSVKFVFFELYLKLVNEPLFGSFSQGGEDLILDKLLGNKKTGFYVDIGAYDPVKFSNTNRFYKRGWHGINIEPNATNFSKFEHMRPRDINLNVGIGENRGQLKFYVLFPATLSTFSKEDMTQHAKEGHNVVETKSIPVEKLSDVLEKHAANTTIDFFSIDTEGFDLSVLKSNDWQQFRPRAICVEKGMHAAEVDNYLTSISYKKVWNNGINSIYLT